MRAISIYMENDARYSGAMNMESFIEVPIPVPDHLKYSQSQTDSPMFQLSLSRVQRCIGNPKFRVQDANYHNSKNMLITDTSKNNIKEQRLLLNYDGNTNFLCLIKLLLFFIIP